LSRDQVISGRASALLRSDLQPKDTFWGGLDRFDEAIIDID
jgi:hypothetical protein